MWLVYNGRVTGAASYGALTSYQGGEREREMERDGGRATERERENDGERERNRERELVPTSYWWRLPEKKTERSRKIKIELHSREHSEKEPERETHSERGSPLGS